MHNILIEDKDKNIVLYINKEYYGGFVFQKNKKYVTDGKNE